MQQQQRQNFPSNGSINSGGDEISTSDSDGIIDLLQFQDGRWVIGNVDDGDSDGDGLMAGFDASTRNGGGTIDLATYESPSASSSKEILSIFSSDGEEDGDREGGDCDENSSSRNINNNNNNGRLPQLPSMTPTATFATATAAATADRATYMPRSEEVLCSPSSYYDEARSTTMSDPTTMAWAKAAEGITQSTTTTSTYHHVIKKKFHTGQVQHLHQDQQLDFGTGPQRFAAQSLSDQPNLASFPQQQATTISPPHHLDDNMNDKEAQRVNTNTSTTQLRHVVDDQYAMPGTVIRNNARPSMMMSGVTDDGRLNIDDLNLNPTAMIDGTGETMLALEMAKLSVNEREKVTQDIHGVNDDVVHETPDLIRQKLAQLDSRLTELGGTTPPSTASLLLSSTVTSVSSPVSSPNNNSNNRNDQNVNMSAYNLAMSLNARYVTDEKFRLIFLRSCDFDVDRAAKRMAMHFEKKLELFGTNRLCQTITQQDLTVDDHECLQSGQSQLLPYRDVSGRAVFFQALSHYRYKQVENAMRAVYYILMSALEDEETQKKGIVCVVYNVEPRSALSNDPQIYLNVYKLLPSLPMKMMGAHYCVQDAHLRLFMSSIRVAMSREVRLRSRVHHGSHQECLYALLTFGLPRRGLPILVATGELSTAKHHEFVEMRRRQENARSRANRPFGNNGPSDGDHAPSVVIVVPTNGDVLFGRGRPQQQNPGNVRCNYFVVANMDEYEKASRNGKTAIARMVVEMIKSNGGRFLKQNDGVWEPVDDTEALRKISHSFRTHRQLVKDQKERQESLSGTQTRGKREYPA